jgi:carboxypeptidase family protein
MPSIVVETVVRVMLNGPTHRGDRMKGSTMKRSIVLAASLFAASCGSSTSSTTPTSTATTTTYTLSGTVTATTTGAAIVGATVTIAGGANPGLATTTDSNGSYSLTGLTASAFMVEVTATHFNPVIDSVTLTGSQTLNVPLSPTPLFIMRGEGNAVFNMPTTVSRVHIVGTYLGVTSSFVVTIGGQIVVNDLVGSQWMPPASDGTYATTGGSVAITNSTGVSWSFIEVR